MHNHPSIEELVAAVKSFVDETAGPQLTGHAAFHARVASNVLATVLRDLQQRPSAEAEERAGLLSLLGETNEENVDALNQMLSDRIRAGDMSVETSGLLAHLKRTTMAQVEIDQPRYSGLKNAKS